MLIAEVNIMNAVRELWEELLTDPEFVELYDKLQVRREVANAIFMSRARKNLSQQELADLCGLRRKTIANYENEDKDINMKVLDQIARSMGCRVQIRFVLTDDQKLCDKALNVTPANTVPFSFDGY
jgi:DNA-binding XRE family transcriptional regulator